MADINLADLNENQLKSLINRAKKQLKKKPDMPRDIDSKDPAIVDLAETIKSIARDKGASREVVVNAVMKRMRMGQRIENQRKKAN